ncbi:nitrogenase iron-molybdenum cofactor biosynthesis protein NifN [Oceanospirillum sediminis]|uniref:Nitrogenase iron-molybdenum cofactor biosynthesis protein NifN n=1 Tax=Oceanospirillum sediminis TaxID=2760088 RepID=A0A839INK0_9GAMM|nr:nitrogenase iron-molybdenum cofactor biosynthesis protein NifN [Oceanospirillum sediminis]MBB1486471.1 nitrogenase iron-molybdenum cofactor biosynthesis protein NifN [Oceanospirillum sediminis]
MVRVIKKQKPLSVNPLKVSQPAGAILAFMGVRNAIPMLHGSQGCSAFAKVLFVRHFREPIPLQTSAMDQTSTVMGADGNVLQGLKTIINARNPELIGIPTTGLSETQGSDVKGLIRQFYLDNPEYQSLPVIPAITPDFSGGLETGFAIALYEMLDRLVPATDCAGENACQVNVLASSMLTGADIDYLKLLLERFGLKAVVVPDLSDSLDGHMMEADFVPVTTGGTPVSAFAELGKASATLVIGHSLNHAADLLTQRTGVEDFRFDGLMGMEAMDQLVNTLHQISGRAVPDTVERERSQLQDVMLDSHFMLGFTRYGIAADPDLLLSFSSLVTSVGGEVVAAVAPHNAPSLNRVCAEEIHISDLEELEQQMVSHKARLLICNAHGAGLAQRLQLPLLRAGWPVYDRLGAQHQLWIGYKGSLQTLIQLANMQLSQAHHHEVAPYVSVYSRREQEMSSCAI